LCDFILLLVLSVSVILDLLDSHLVQFFIFIFFMNFFIVVGCDFDFVFSMIFVAHGKENRILWKKQRDKKKKEE
jgi:hypothetical protein